MELHDAMLACRLLKNCNINDIHFQLVLSATPEITFDEMRQILKHLQKQWGGCCSWK